MKITVFGPGDGADLLGHVGPQLLAALVVGSAGPATRVTKATMAWPVVASLAPTTAASATNGWSTSADSTSVVEIRWPDTFITSSTRPSSHR